MYLINLIQELEKEDQTKIVPLGFHNPHSYRGDYYCLAFEPKENVMVEEMLSAAKQANGSTYEGYKGGEFEMGDFTRCYLAQEGDTGETIGPVLLNYMLDKYPRS